MKKIGVILILLNFYYLITAQSIVYSTKRQSFVFNDSNVFFELPLNEQGDEIDKGTAIEYELGDGYFCYISGENHSVIANKNHEWFLLEDLKRKNFNVDVHQKINGTWIAAYYYDVYDVNNVSELKKNETFWDKEWKYDGDRWQDEIYPSYIYISDNYFILQTNDGYKRSYLIMSENDSYEFDVYLGDLFLTPDFYSKTNFVNNYKDKGVYQFKLILDGDYLSLYDGKTNKLLMRFARTKDRFVDRENLRTIANGKQIIKSNITWPRHADGSCDYDGSKKTVSISATNVTPNKTMLVTENLKLRSGEATTSEVLTVMSAGTKVKILELGKSEIIDGISSNWVKVEVQSGAKDRDGRAIRAGTVGWCYGGYLK